MALFGDKLRDWRNLKSWRPYFLLVLVGFILYSQTLFFDFTYFDDSTLILDKAVFLQDVQNVGQIFSADVFSSVDKFYYRPFLNLSFMGDAQIGGTLPFVYHLDNILLHILAVILLFYLLERLIKRRALAFYLALLFLAHPVLTQAVAWVPGRNDSLLAVFILAAFIVFLNFLQRPRLRSYIGYLLLLFCALLTKENAAVLPVLIIFYFYFIDRGALQKTDRWLLIIGSAAVGFIWFLLRHLALGQEPTNYFSAALGSTGNAPAVLLDLGKLIFPFNLSVLPVLRDSTLVYGIIAALILLAALILSRRKRYNYIIFGSLWFFAFLLPSFITFNDSSGFLEHRLYLSLIGFLIVVAEIDWIKNWNFNSRPGRLLAGAIVIIFIALTLGQSTKFSDRLTFWRQAVADSPHSPLAQRNLGAMYYFQGDLPAAEKYDKQAIALNPQEPMVHNNLGVIYLAQKKDNLAEAAFKTELTVNPNYDKALFNLGDLYDQEKKTDLAAQFWTAALQVNPGYYEAYSRLLNLQNRLR
jgi:tetratricopeptide (TPR) repeat protein